MILEILKSGILTIFAPDFKINTMEIIIRDAAKEDMPAVLNLIRHLAEFEKAPEAVTVTVEELQKDGFQARPLFKVFLAEVENEVVGMALIYTGYSTWKGKLVYLDDLIVKEGFRNRGIGKKLMDKVIDFAAQENAKVLKWQVLDWNENAIRFYKSYPVTFDSEWIDCKLFKQDIESVVVSGASAGHETRV